ncbi:MAG: dCTP deaminase [Romboutsia timonensis]
MILTGEEIKRRYNNGDIYIDNFDATKVNPNSYNLKLHNKLLIYDNLLDMKKENKATEIIIPEDGFLLQPGRLYLGRTLERTETHNLVPMLEGRSSVGRLGVFIHATAGFGDVGFNGYWTLEISCVEPVIIYPNIDICQIYYHTVQGAITEYEGKYQNNEGIQESKLYCDELVYPKGIE